MRAKRGWLSFLFGFSLLTIGFLAGGWFADFFPFRTAKAPNPQPSQQWQAVLFLPTVDNDGQPFSPEKWEEALRTLVKPFGGATLGEKLEGLWLNREQKVQREPIRVVRVTVASDRLDELRAVVRKIGEILEQEAVYYHLEKRHAELIRIRSR